MKKTKKIKKLLSSFVCLIGSAIGITTGLSSCVLNPNDDKNEDDTDDSVITPPNDDNSNDNNNNENNGGNGNEGNNGSDNEKPSEPDTKPEVKPPVDNKPTDPNPPENKPESTPPSSNLISDNSISLKEHGKLLPSQYLSDTNDLNNLNIGEIKIVENFDKTKVVWSKYILSSLNDEDGTLSIKMEYKDPSNKSYEFIFSFNNLASLKNQNYSLSFNIGNKNLLNAKEISDKQITNDTDSKLFLDYLKSHDTNLIFKNGINELPLRYLNFEGGLVFNGFDKSWYTSNNNMNLKVQPKSLKINSYHKDLSSNTIFIKKIEYPSHLIGSNKNPINLSCPSVLDFLLEKITINEDYKDDKYANYYYYDIVNNNSEQTQLQLSNDKWLKNIIHDFDGYAEKRYKPIISKSIDPSIDSDGNLIIQIQIQISDENITSKDYKQLVIKSCLKLNGELFYYSGSKHNKFNLFCNADNMDKILSNIKRHRNYQNIKNEINNNNLNVSKYFVKQEYKNLIINYIKLYFGDSEIVKDDSLGYFMSTNNDLSIENYHIDDDDIEIKYNKDYNCFQLRCKLSIQCEGLDSGLITSDYITINITKNGAEL